MTCREIRARLESAGFAVRRVRAMTDGDIEVALRGDYQPGRWDAVREALWQMAPDISAYIH